MLREEAVHIVATIFQDLGVVALPRARQSDLSVKCDRQGLQQWLQVTR